MNLTRISMSVVGYFELDHQPVSASISSRRKHNPQTLLFVGSLYAACSAPGTLD